MGDIIELFVIALAVIIGVPVGSVFADFRYSQNLSVR